MTIYIDKYLRVVVKYPTYPSSKISGWVYCNLGCTFPWIMDLVTSQVVTEAALNEKLAERKEGHHLNLVGGFEHYLFSIIYGMSSFPLTFIFFKMVKTTNQKFMGIQPSQRGPNNCWLGFAPWWLISHFPESQQLGGEPPLF